MTNFILTYIKQEISRQSYQRVQGETVTQELCFI